MNPKNKLELARHLNSAEADHEPVVVEIPGSRYRLIVSLPKRILQTYGHNAAAFEAAIDRILEVTQMPEARLHDGSTIEIEVHGAGPTLLLPVNPRPIEGEQAEQMRKYGVDPALGQSLIKGLSDGFRVVVFDYEGHVMGTPKPDTLTPANVATDLLAVADAAGADQFAYYGYSWLALVGLQLAIRTNRLSALIMGAFRRSTGHT